MSTLRIRDILQRVFFKPQATAPTQTAGIADIYVKTDKSLYYRDIDGAETSISGASVTSAPTFNATTSFTLGGANINDSNTLDNIAYLDYENIYSNNLWQKALDKFGSESNIWKLNELGEIDLGSPINIASLRVPTDSVVPIADIGMTSTADYGDEAGISVWVGGTEMIYARAENDGTGGIVNGSDYVKVNNIWPVDLRWTAVKTGNAEIGSVPVNCRLVSVTVLETTGNAVDISIGTSVGGTQIVNAQTCAASSWKVFDNSDFALAMFSTTADTAIYISSADWNSSSLTIYMVFEKIAE